MGPFIVRINFSFALVSLDRFDNSAPLHIESATSEVKLKLLANKTESIEIPLIENVPLAIVIGLKIQYIPIKSNICTVQYN